MNYKINKKKFTIIIILIFIFCYLLINLTIGSNKFGSLKQFISHDQRQLIKKYIFPYKLISEQEKNIALLSEELTRLEKNFIITLQDREIQKKNEGSEILTRQKVINLSNNQNLKKHQLTSGFYSGINNFSPGSGYIDFNEDKIFVLSSRGVLAFKNNFEDKNENFKQIKNNIHEFIGLNQFKKNKWFSIKDLHIYNNKVFVSFSEEIKENCWNTSIIFADINYQRIEFEKMFSPKKCVHSIKNFDNEFSAYQAGGRITSYNDNFILLSMGDYKSRPLAQDDRSVNGKIIKINVNNSDYEIISMGHRNPQGLYFDKENNFILETEHGPQGGDEINLIEIDKINNSTIQNFGWPVSSAGEHYGGKIERNQKKYEKYPLYKSHSEHGFIEPLHSFVPSIAISEIVKIGQNRYVVSSLKDKSIYFFELNKKKIVNLNKIEVFERVRDLKFKDNQLYLFLEDTASIGVINFK